MTTTNTNTGENLGDKIYASIIGALRAEKLTTAGLAALVGEGRSDVIVSIATRLDDNSKGDKAVKNARLSRLRRALRDATIDEEGNGAMTVKFVEGKYAYCPATKSERSNKGTVTKAAELLMSEDLSSLDSATIAALAAKLAKLAEKVGE